MVAYTPKGFSCLFCLFNLLHLVCKKGFGMEWVFLNILTSKLVNIYIYIRNREQAFTLAPYCTCLNNKFIE
jgi:hypothetical protein